jgi:glycosyltransferase 2 family protein
VPPTPGHAEAGEGSAGPRRRSAWRLLGWALSAGIFAAALLPLRDRWSAVGDAGGLPGLIPATGAVAAYLLANGVLADTWRRVVLVTGTRLAFGEAAWIWALSQLARYTVGAAQVAGRAVVGRRYGVGAAAGAVTTLVEVGWQTSITAALMLATLPWWLPGAGDLGWLAWVAVLPVAVLAVGLVWPDGLLRGLARLLAAVPIPRLDRRRLAERVGGVALSPAEALALTARFAANSALRLAAFLLLFAAVGGAVASDWPVAVGAYAVGQVVGRLAVFAPGGIGPREGATLLVVAQVLGGGPALVLVAATRLLEMVAELAFFGVARVLRGAAPA